MKTGKERYMQELDHDKIVAKLQRILTGRLNQLCREQHLTLKELSRKSGVSLSTIRRVAQGKHCNIGIDKVIKFSKAFGITPSQFTDGTLLETEDRRKEPNKYDL